MEKGISHESFAPVTKNIMIPIINMKRPVEKSF